LRLWRPAALGFHFPDCSSIQARVQRRTNTFQRTSVIFIFVCRRFVCIDTHGAAPRSRFQRRRPSDQFIFFVELSVAVDARF
jgi:hypothetical protein